MPLKVNKQNVSFSLFPAIDLQKKDNIPWIFCRTDMKKFDDKWK